MRTGVPFLDHFISFVYIPSAQGFFAFATQWNQINLNNSQFSEFYRRKEKPLGLDIIQFVNFSYIDYMVPSMFFSN